MDKTGRHSTVPTLPGRLHVLGVGHILLIDEALHSLGPFSEVRLIKIKGKLRYIDKLESESLSPADEGGRNPSQSKTTHS